MRKLLSLNLILNISDVKALRTLYDTIKTQVLSLHSLGQDCAYYGPMLIPVLLTKLPSELNLQISRKCGKDIWDVREVLDLINLEIEAREKVVVHEEKSESDRMFSGSALFSASNQRNVKKGIFCYQENHKSHQCKLVSKPEVRKGIILFKRLCYICLKAGHIAKTCRSNFHCFKCKLKGGTMFLFARLHMLVVIKILMIVNILQGMLLLRLINKMMTKRKLQ